MSIFTYMLNSHWINKYMKANRVSCTQSQAKLVNMTFEIDPSIYPYHTNIYSTLIHSHSQKEAERNKLCTKQCSCKESQCHKPIPHNLCWKIKRNCINFFGSLKNAFTYFMLYAQKTKTKKKKTPSIDRN